jgi:hypothetical protein
LSSLLEKLPRNIAANAELTNQAGWQSGGIIDPLGFVVPGTVLMALITPPVLALADELRDAAMDVGTIVGAVAAVNLGRGPM